MIPAAESLAAGLEATPYARRLGFRPEDVMGDVVSASVPYSAQLANAQGFVHGGVAASLAVWSAMLVAVASDRASATAARPVSLSLSYLTAARGEALHATARLAARGRDLVHVEIEVATERGRAVAVGLAVLRTLADPARPARPISAGATAPAAHRDDRRLISPFSQSMGIELRSREELADYDAGAAVGMVMRRDGNEGLGSATDPGALVALADTCAALACLPSLDERYSGSATLSLSAVFGGALFAPALAVGRSVAEDGGVRSALIDIRREGEPSRSRRSAMTACVAYRFRSAEEL